MINPGTHTIASVSGPREYETKNGKFNDYTLGLEGDDGTYSYSRKITSPAPTVGQRIDVASVDDTSNGKYPPKIRLAQANRSVSFGSSGGKSPEESARIVRQSAQKAAIQWAVLAHQRGKLPDDFKLADITPIIDFFYADSWRAKP